MLDQSELEILLVEDNPNDAEMAIRSLKKHHLANKLIWLQDGAKAIEFLFAQGEYSHRDTSETPKVILLDLKLPKINGLEVLEKIKSDEQLSKVPVVVLTSSKEEQDVVKSYDLGVNSYIVKPVEFENFATAIAEIGLYWLVTNTSPS